MAAGGGSFEEVFALFSKFGDTKSDGKSITLTQSDKWMKQAGIFGKQITTTDTGICFNKFKMKTMDIKTYQKYLEDLASSKKMDANKDIIAKMVSCGAPGTSGATQAVHVGGVDRLTDTTQYTGTHKERFDAEGKGKGKEGREDTAKNDGYVQGYTNKDTYDKTHKK